MDYNDSLNAAQHLNFFFPDQESSFFNDTWFRGYIQIRNPLSKPRDSMGLLNSLRDKSTLAKGQ